MLRATFVPSSTHQQCYQYIIRLSLIYYQINHSKSSIVVLCLVGKEFISLWVERSLHHHVCLALLAEEFDQVFCIHLFFVVVLSEENQVVQVR